MLKIIVKRLVLIEMVFIVLMPIVVQADPLIIITFLHPFSILPYLLSHPQQGEIIESSGGPRHLSTISLKNFHLFKIAKLIINFCLKFFFN